MARQSIASVHTLGSPSNEGVFHFPFTVAVQLQGISDLLFCRFSPDAVLSKASLPKGSRGKKEDDIEAFLYRNEQGEISLPGEYVRQSVIHASKYWQDPRNPRKSAMDLVKAGVVCLTPLASLGIKEPDYLDRRRVVVQRNAVVRVRPAICKGWTCEMLFQVMLPEYITPEFFHELLLQAGRLIGVGDFRPTFGRYTVIKYELLKE